MLLMNKLPCYYQANIDILHLHNNLSADKIRGLVKKEERNKICESPSLASRRYRETKNRYQDESDVSMKDSSDLSIYSFEMCFLFKGYHFKKIVYTSKLKNLGRICVRKARNKKNSRKK